MNTQAILSELERLYPDARPALHYSSPYELLVAVILSAQCTDERVNKVTAELFKNYNVPQTMVTLTQEELEKYIFSCGFYHNKAAHILEELQSLAGVGRKTANVVYSVAFGGAAIAVDTHVFRVANRTGLAVGKTPTAVEEGLMQVIPKENWAKAHHWLIYHGRRVCHSQRPDCKNCTLAKWCTYASKTV